MRVTETQVPGVGERFVVEFEDGGRLVVLIENDGDRRVRWGPARDADSEPLFDVSEREARTIAEIFEGAYFESVDENLEDALENALVEWIEVDRDAPVVDRTLRESGIRTKTGVSVIAVQRADRTHSNPDPSFTIEAGDVLVVVGSKEAHERFEVFLTGEE